MWSIMSLDLASDNLNTHPHIAWFICTQTLFVLNELYTIWLRKVLCYGFIFLLVILLSLTLFSLCGHYQTKSCTHVCGLKFFLSDPSSLLLNGFGFFLLNVLHLQLATYHESSWSKLPNTYNISFFFLL